LRYVRSCPLADISRCAAFVRFQRSSGPDNLRIWRRTQRGNTVMNATIRREDAEEILSRDVSDEALEMAGAGHEIAGGYTLQFCTSQDCALVS
jgi:hypothetical protein